jgi:hypothetical protein
LKEDIKDLNKKLTAARKNLDNQLAMKHQHAERRVQLGVDKEQLATECVRKTRLQWLENSDNNHQNKQELVQDKKRAAMDVTRCLRRSRNKNKKELCHPGG